MASLVVLTSERERSHGGLPRFLQATVPQVGLTEVDNAHGLAVPEELGVLHCLLEPHHGRRNSPGERVSFPER
jgi:hypothetical protein